MLRWGPEQKEPDGPEERRKEEERRGEDKRGEERRGEKQSAKSCLSDTQMDLEYWRQVGIQSRIQKRYA